MSAFENPAGFVAAVQKVYRNMAPWFLSSDDPDVFLRVRLDGAHPKVSDSLLLQLSDARSQAHSAAVSAHVAPISLKDAVQAVRAHPDVRFAYLQGIRVRKFAEDYCGCSFCLKPFGARAFKCPTCRDQYSELLIACESCHKDDVCGHVREPLDFSDTTFGVQ